MEIQHYLSKKQPEWANGCRTQRGDDVSAANDMQTKTQMLSVVWTPKY